MGNQTSTKQEDLHEDVHEETSAEEDKVTKKFQEIEELPQKTLRRSTWFGKFPRRYEDYASFVSLISKLYGEASYYQQAMEVFEFAN